jgi:hypothetical protein
VSGGTGRGSGGRRGGGRSGRCRGRIVGGVCRWERSGLSAGVLGRHVGGVVGGAEGRGLGGHLSRLGGGVLRGEDVDTVISVASDRVRKQGARGAIVGSREKDCAVSGLGATIAGSRAYTVATPGGDDAGDGTGLLVAVDEDRNVGTSDAAVSDVCDDTAAAGAHTAATGGRAGAAVGPVAYSAVDWAGVAVASLSLLEFRAFSATMLGRAGYEAGTRFSATTAGLGADAP